MTALFHLLAALILARKSLILNFIQKFWVFFRPKARSIQNRHDYTNNSNILQCPMRKLKIWLKKRNNLISVFCLFFYLSQPPPSPMPKNSMIADGFYDEWTFVMRNPDDYCAVNDVTTNYWHWWSRSVTICSRMATVTMIFDYLTMNDARTMNLVACVVAVAAWPL